MYKILNSEGLGVGGRQNELIELALTYGFNGVEVDVVDLVGRHDTLGKQFACQFLQSASTDMATFCLPFQLDGTDEEYAASIEKTDTILDLAQTLGAKQCYVKIKPTSKNFTFQENFEKHQTRLQELGEKFAAVGIRIGVALQASGVSVGEGEYKFVHTAEEILTLAKTVGHDNVGLCLDCWEWAVGGGTLDQLKSVDAKQLITELRLADVAEGVDMAAATKKDRTALPGDNEGSLSFALTQHLVAADYEGPISVATAVATFDDESRDKVVEALSKRLDQIIAGEDPSIVIEPEAIDGESGESADGEASVADATVEATTVEATTEESVTEEVVAAATEG
jgi:sugar phosphate isomerase/epimerase